MKKLILFALLVLGAALPARATTYYISYSSGSNSNPGTKASPWKSHPYMQTGAGCAGAAPSYSHSAGDIFIFKQGDSWPNACFDMIIQAGGGSGNPDQYTYDPTFGTPIGTTGNKGQAVGVYEWNANGAAIHGSSNFNRFVLDNGNPWVTFNGFALNGFQAPGTGSFGNDVGFDIQSTTNIIWSNCYIHGWTHTGSSSDSLTWFLGHDGGSSPNNAGARVTGCVVDGANSGGSGVANSGSLTFKIPLSDNNLVRNMPNAFLTGANASIHDNVIGPMSGSFDSGSHNNCIEPITSITGATSTNYIYNNTWFGCDEVALLTQGEGPSNGSEIDYVWNNVGYLGTTAHIPAAIFEFSSVVTGNASEVHAWNNTAYAGSSIPCFRTLSQGGPNFAVLDIRNNHCISDNSLLLNQNPGNSQTLTPNTTMTTAVATSQGYTASQTFAYSPTLATNGTVGAGNNLSSLATGNFTTLQNDTTYGGTRTTNARPGSGAWNSGAYQLVSSSTLLQVGPGQTYTTIQACLTAATSGQICNVHAGTYAGATFATVNTAVQANPGDTVTLTSQLISTKNNCTINGLTLTGMTLTNAGAIDVRGTTGCVITNNITHDLQGTGIYSRLNSNTLIQGNTVFNITGPCCISDGDGIVLYSSSSTDSTYAHGVRALNNEIYGSHQDGLEINGSWETVANNYIHDNIYSNYASVHPDGVECNGIDDGISECPHTLIYNNIIKNHNQNIYIDGLGTTAANTDIWVFNNILYSDPTSSTGVDMTVASASDAIFEQADRVHFLNNTTGLIQFYGYLAGDGGGGGGTQTNFDVQNNIFTSSLMDGLRANPSSAIATLDYDDYFNNPTVISFNSTNYSTVAAFHTATGFETHGIGTNPLLNPFPTPTLQSGSPAINTANNLTGLSGAPAALFADITGNPRPATGPWSMGAYNSTGGPPPPPAVSFAPGSLAFDNVIVGATSSPQVTTLSNTGGTTLNISSIAITGINSSDFTSSTTCGTTVLAGASCTITITFRPSAIGARTAAISVTDNASGSPQAVPLTGTGANSAAAVTLAPTSLTFGSQAVGGSSTPQSITLTNSGGSTLNITSITLAGTDPGDYSRTTTCGTTLATGLSCTVSVTFTPTTTGSRPATVTITDSAANSPQTAALSGTGTTNPAVVALSPTSVAFGNQTTGTTSSLVPITLSNTGGANLAITSITVTGTNANQFAQSNNCGATVAGGASCIINVSFHPTLAQADTATVTITDSASGSPHTVPLTGTGTSAPQPAITFSPLAVAFGNQTVSTTSAQQTITITNSGNASMTISGINITGTNVGDFAQTNNCPGTLAAGLSCLAQVTFTPTITGARSANFNVSDSVPDGHPDIVPMTGTGVSAPPSVTVAPTSIAFPNTISGQSSTAHVILLTNTGGSVLTISSISVAGVNANQFSQTNNCGTTVNPAGTCNISVVFSPNAVGSFSAAVNVVDNASGSPQVVPITGSGITQPLGVISLAPTSLNFGNEVQSVPSSSRTVTLTNTGGGSITITSISKSGTNAADYTDPSNTCTGTIAPAGTCTIPIIFTPSGLGTRTATFTVAGITGNVVLTPGTIALTGVGVAAPVPVASPSPSSLSFGNQTVTVPSVGQVTTLTNSGSATLTLSGITVTGTNATDFTFHTSCGATLAASATCTVTVTFQPALVGAKTAAISFADNASGSPQTVPLTGTGTPIPTATPVAPNQVIIILE